MAASFWRWAYRRYHGRRLSVLAEVAAFVWFTFFALVYGGALVAGWLPNASEAALGMILTIGPLLYGLGHQRIRIESRKPDGLYRKMLLAMREKGE